MKPVLLAAAAALALGQLTSVSAEEKATDLAATLKGKLIALQDDEIVEAELTGDPEYYVLYHSASW